METFEEIPTKRVKILENIRTRIEEKDLLGLMTDIKQRGLLHPIGVWQEGKQYILRFGQRRLEACKKLGWDTITAKVSDQRMNEKDFMTMNVAENIHREDITPIELGRICKRLSREKNMAIGEIAVALSISRDRVKSALNIYEQVPEDFVKDIKYMNQREGRNKAGFISATTVNSILSMANGDKSMVKKLLKVTRKEELTQQDLRLIREMILKGCTIEEALKKRHKYKVLSIALILNKKELKGYKGVPTRVVHSILAGKTPANKNLVLDIGARKKG